MLKEEGISCKEEKNEFPGCAEKQKKEDLKVMQTFTFLCLAAAVICGMLNYLMMETLNWFWFAAAGCICAWLIVYVAYMKRRSILKNEMWQLLIITFLCVLWDHFTGWRGWSIDFVFPFGALAVLTSIPVIAKIKSSGTRGIPVLSDTGCHHRLCSGNPDCSRDDNLYLAICLKYRNQFSDAGRIVYFQNEGYFTRNKKETESIKSCCEQLLKSYCKQLQQLLKAFDLQ